MSRALIDRAEPAGRSRRRGAALLLVLVFGVGCMVLVITLLSLAGQNVRGQADNHRQLQLHCVLRAGIADAINEINRTRTDPPPPNPDPGGDGVGALTVGADGLKGIAVLSPTGQILGRYRATISTAGGTSTLTVVAVSKDFDTLPERQHVMAAQLEISRGHPPFPANALSLTGDTDAGYNAATRPGFICTGNPSLKVADAEFGVPAVNITDPSAFTHFTTDPPGAARSIVDGADTLVGADPSNPGSSASGIDTVTNESAGVLSEDSLHRISSGIDTYCNDHTVGTNGTVGFVAATTAGGASFSGGTLTGSVTLPNGIYRLGVDMDLKANITGSGTLIITKKMFVDTGGSITWNGTVIVQSDSAELTMKKNVTVNGVLALQAIGSTAKITEQNGCDVEVTGAYVVLADAGTSLTIDGGAKTTVVGIFTLLGEDVGFDLQNGSELNVQGSLAIAVPTGATLGVDKVDFGSGSHADLEFDQSKFSSGIDVLGAFFDPDGKVLPISAPKYWEVAAPQMMATQQAQVTAGGNLGMP
jgi:hypothetical protein